MTPSHDTHREGKNLQMFEGMASLESGHVRLGGLRLEIHNERFRDHEIAVEADAVGPQALARGDYRVWPVCLRSLPCQRLITRARGQDSGVRAAHNPLAPYVGYARKHTRDSACASPLPSAHTHHDRQPARHTHRQTDRQTDTQTDRSLQCLRLMSESTSNSDPAASQPPSEPERDRASLIEPCALAYVNRLLTLCPPLAYTIAY